MAMTSHELALKCGVSRGTVDRALKGRARINPATKAKVLEAAKKYGYRPNFIGSALSSGRTMMIGIIIFDFRHSFFSELYSAFEHEAEQFNYITFPMLSYHAPEREIECIKRLADRNVDGMIILPVNQGPKFEKMLDSLNIPVVCIGNRLSANFPFSGIDDFQAASDAVEFLADKSYEKIYYYCPPTKKQNHINHYAQEQRLYGYESGIRDAGVSGSAETERNALINLLKHDPGNTAVMCSNDFYALELQIFLRDFFPELYSKVMIMGFDGLDVIKFSHPQIPTVTFSRKEWALKAFGQIYKKLNGEDDIRDEIITHQVFGRLDRDFK